MGLNAKQIELLVARNFGTMRNLIVPNVSHGFEPCALWEMDLVVVTKAGYLYEVEIKTSVADLKRDRQKNRWTNPVWRTRFDEVVSQYFIAMPETEFKKLKDLSFFPDCAGIIVVLDESSIYGRVRYERPSKKKRGRKLTEREIYSLARLGTIRYWTRHDEKQAVA